LTLFSSPSTKRITNWFAGLLHPKLHGIFKGSEDRGRERYRKAGITASVALIQKVLTIGISFASVPLTVHYLGPERYGVWLTISSLLIWMSMTDFGLAGNALINVLSEANGNDDRLEAQRYASSAIWALNAIAAILAVAVIASFRFIPWNSVFKVTSMSSHELATACALALLFFILSLPLSVQYSIYTAYQDGFLSNVWGIISNICALITLVIVTRLHGGLPQLVLALSGTRVFLAFLNLCYMFFKRYRWLMPVPSAVHWYCVRRLFKLGMKYVVTQLGALGIYQSQPMIITQILGPTSVIIFVIAQKIITLPLDLVYMLTAPFVPAFGEAKARNDWPWIKSAYRNATLVSVVIGLPVTLLIAVVAKPLIRVWAGPAAVPDTSLIFWLSAYNLFGLVIMVTGQLLIGLERVNALAVSLVLCALVTIGLGIGFGRGIGLSGVAMAMAVGKVITLWPIQLWAIREIFISAKISPVEATSEVT
jgi:O-antigen/teichoic acid export membrane protein